MLIELMFEDVQCFGLFIRFHRVLFETRDVLEAQFLGGGGESEPTLDESLSLVVLASSVGLLSLLFQQACVSLDLMGMKTVDGNTDDGRSPDQDGYGPNIHSPLHMVRCLKCQSIPEWVCKYGL